MKSCMCYLYLNNFVLCHYACLFSLHVFMFVVISFTEKQMDFVNANFKKMKVKELKKVLNIWGEDCKGCSEKSDFIARIEKLLPQYAPEAAAARKARTEL